MTAKDQVLKAIRDAFITEVNLSERRILDAVERYVENDPTKGLQDTFIYRNEVGEEDGPLEQLEWITGDNGGHGLKAVTQKLGIKEPLLEMLVGWTDNRKVYYEEWVKILMEQAYKAGRESMAELVSQLPRRGK